MDVVTLFFRMANILNKRKNYVLSGITLNKGKAIIFTEKPACESCLDVKQQFMKKYPNQEKQH